MKFFLAPFFCFGLFCVILAQETQFSCPNNCLANGECLDQRCVCDEGWFGFDCGTQATKLELDKYIQEEITPESTVYFYSFFDNTTEVLELKIHIPSGEVKLYSLIQRQDSYETPENEYNTTYTFIAGSEAMVITYSMRDLLSVENGKIIIGFNNPKKSTSAIMRVSLNSVPSKKNKIQSKHYFKTVSGIILCCVLTFTFLSLCICFPQTKCSICIEDLSEESKCRQLYCEHIFHDKCIDKWLMKQSSCPDCRKSMTKKDVKQALRELKKQKNKERIFKTCGIASPRRLVFIKKSPESVDLERGISYKITKTT